MGWVSKKGKKKQLMAPRLVFFPTRENQNPFIKAGPRLGHFVEALMRPPVSQWVFRVESVASLPSLQTKHHTGVNTCLPNGFLLKKPPSPYALVANIKFDSIMSSILLDLCIQHIVMRAPAVTFSWLSEKQDCCLNQLKYMITPQGSTVIATNLSLSKP